MEIGIHDRVLVALDVLRPEERETVQHALDALAADPQAQRQLKPLPQIDRGPFYSLRIAGDLLLLFKRIREAPARFELREIMRMETVRSFIPNSNAA